VPVNLTNAKGDTLLLLAAYAPHPAVVRVLLERGADPHRVNDRGQTALAAAAFRSSAEGVELLLAAGADPYAGNPSALATARFFELPEWWNCWSADRGAHLREQFGLSVAGLRVVPR